VSQHQSHGSGYRSMGYGSAYTASYEVAQESWRRMAQAFYQLHELMRVERDRYYARHRAPGFRYRNDSQKDGYYRR